MPEELSSHIKEIKTQMLYRTLRVSLTIGEQRELYGYFLSLISLEKVKHTSYCDGLKCLSDKCRVGKVSRREA